MSPFADAYPNDICGDDLMREFRDFGAVMSNISEPPTTALEQLMKYLASWDEDVCPNLRVALQILLTIECTLAGCERSFSKLKLTLMYLRTTMTEERLTKLSLLSIEKKRQLPVISTPSSTNSCELKSENLNCASYVGQLCMLSNALHPFMT